MTKKAPGRSHRKGLSLVDAIQRFGDEERAERMFIEARWPNGVSCPNCSSLEVKARPTRKPAPWRCSVCRFDFSVKTRTVMEGSNLPLHKWALAIFLLTTNLKGVSSMKLHRDLDVTQKTAWHLAHRIRRLGRTATARLRGRSKPTRPLSAGRKRTSTPTRSCGQAEGRLARLSSPVSATARPARSAPPWLTALTARRSRGSSVSMPLTLNRLHGRARGISRLALPARDRQPLRQRVRPWTSAHERTRIVLGYVEAGIPRTYHHMSAKHLSRYVGEFEGRHNDRPADTIDQVRHLAKGMEGKRLRYRDLVA